MWSQVSAIGEPQPESWDDYERGCLLTYRGGHHDAESLSAFQHGMRTVFNLLRGEFPPAERCKEAERVLDSHALLVEAQDALGLVSRYRHEPRSEVVLVADLAKLPPSDEPCRLSRFLRESRVPRDVQGDTTHVIVVSGDDPAERDLVARSG